VRVPHDSPLSRKKYADLSAGIRSDPSPLFTMGEDPLHARKQVGAKLSFAKEHHLNGVESITISVSSLTRFG
jgi:hypothetical protein